MFAKRAQYKSKITHFSSEDSQNTDNSMNSSLEIAETNAQNQSSNKFNQLKETMNQMFIANPELAEEIKFEQYHIDEEIEAESPKHNLNSLNSSSPPATNKGLLINIRDHSQETTTSPQMGQTSSNHSSKFWSAISKEMTKPQKNSKAPSLPQINHILNIFKTKFEKVEPVEASLSPSKSSGNLQKAAKNNEFRIQSAKFKGEKKFGLKGKDGKNGLGGLTSPQSTNGDALEEEEDGVMYYSSRKKTHLKLKKKRRERELEEQQMKKELEAEREKLEKELEQKQMLSTLAELDEEILRNKINNPDVEQSGEGTSRNNTKLKGRISSNMRSNSIKKGDNIFDRLTKDFNRKPTTDDEEDIQTRRTFISPFAESLYKDMKAFGDAEAFKKIAQTRIMNYKKEFKEKLSKQKQLPVEGLKFSKESTRHLNMFLPDFEKSVPVPNKDAIFSMHEVHRDTEEWRDNPEFEIIAKFQKLKQGNLLEFWKETKDLDQ